MATHSSVLAWRIPGMGEPGGLPSMGLHRVGHDWSDLAAAVAATVQMLSDGGLLPRPLSGLLTLRNELSKEINMLTKQKTIGKGYPGGQQQVRETQNYSAIWLSVSAFLVVGLAFCVVSGQSSCLCPYLVWLRVLHGGRCISKPRWIPEQGFLGGSQDILWAGISSLLPPPSPTEFSWLVLAAASFSLLVPCIVKQLMKMVLIMPGQGGWFHSAVP